ncbi:MAG: tRNA(Ile)-lysidine synthase [Gammaproteobacteria bacterium]|jgi:tRNA(Ile)-lysidine synthase|nr:tRNA(Ile)-lysidine synthase [Gammaproteobacteria bacterium]
MSFSAASLHAALDSSVPEGCAGLVVALSGGADSSVLLAATAAVGQGFRGLPLRAVHIDHGLQACAAKFRDVSQNLCEHLGVPLTIIRVEVERGAGLSIEACAREARYAAFARELKPKECLLTAHHRKDQAETLLLQALRGAGVKGLSAMPVARALGSGWHVRPLLDVAHRDLLHFGEHLKNFEWADPMNSDLRFDRAYLRHAMWPLIEKRWPGAEISLSRTARHMADAQQMLDWAAAAEVARLRDGEALSVPGLRALAPFKRMSVLREWLGEAGADAPPASRLAEALRQVLEAHSDHQPAIAWGHHALRRYRQRLFLTDVDPPRLEPGSWSTAAGTVFPLGRNLGSLSWRVRAGGIAVDALPALVTVRGREGGESLKPAVSASTQTVQHLCQSQGVLPWMRDALPFIFAGDQLIAVADLWIDARWCVAANQPGLCIEWTDGPIMT